jgi:hypothetical protein
MVPKWIDSVEQLQELEQHIQFTGIVGIDTEWANRCNNDAAETTKMPVAATFQIAIVLNGQQSANATYNVDLLVCDTNPEYQMACRTLLLKLLGNDSLVVLGFSLGHDMPKLEERIEGMSLPRTNVLDLQRLWTHQEPPSLATCMAQYWPSVQLSKREQCSNWRQWPLRPEQAEYAALDAVVFLVMLAEKFWAEQS